GNAFAPGEFNINVGDSIKFKIATDEPHTVTFGAVPSNEDPTEFSTFTGAPPDIGSDDVTAGGVSSTGLIFNGFTATFNCPTDGDFGFDCEIHPGMTGTVHVKP